MPEVIFSNATMVSFTLNEILKVRYWRGATKYLIIITTAVPKMAYNSSHIIKKDNTFLNTNNTRDENLYPLFTTEYYWNNTYARFVEFQYSVKDIENRTMPCNDTFIGLFKNEVFSVNISTHGLHPYTSYSFKVAACNEIGCNYDEMKSFEASTTTYKPSLSPLNVTLVAAGLTGLVANWSEIDPFHQNGEILGYKAILMVNRTDKVYENFTASFSTEFQNVGKYEWGCFIVAAYTNYPEYGPFSDSVCAFTNQSGMSSHQSILALFMSLSLPPSLSLSVSTTQSLYLSLFVFFSLYLS